MDLNDNITFLNDKITMIQNNSLVNSNVGIIGDSLLYWVQLTNYIGICGLISVLGIAANVINIIVFIRQGLLSDSSNISLLGLAVSDLMCLITLFWCSICFLIIYIKPTNLNFDPFAVMVVTAGRPHSMFGQITCLITAYISLERCMCVLLPLKFKMIFTPRRTAMIMPSIFIINIALFYVPLYSKEYLKWQSIGNMSKEFLTYYQEDDYLEAYKVLSYCNQIIRALCVLGVFVFTHITAHRVHSTSKWRKMITSGVSSQPSNTISESSKTDLKKDIANPNNADQISQKDKKLIRMIRAISIIFLLCYSGEMICIASERLEPEIRPGGKYNNLFFFTYAFTFVLGAINSSCNIVVYYKMSTKYRTEFRRLFSITD